MKPLINLISKWIKGKQDYLSLKKYRIFDNLSHFELNLVYQMFIRREYSAGEVIFERGYPLEVVYFIESGELEVFSKVHGKQSRILGEGDYIGLIDMYYEKIRSSSAIAVKDTVMLAISRTDLQSFICSKAPTGVKILNNICTELSRSVFLVVERFTNSDESD